MKGNNSKVNWRFWSAWPLSNNQVRFDPISYAACVELEVFIKEIMYYEIRTHEQWKVVEKFGKTMYKMHHNG